MSSSDKPSEPTPPPFSASNSWVISRARGLIGYDTYSIEKWLSEIEDGGADENDGDHSEMGYSHHPAGALEDYDPDCVAFSRMSIIEKLEAMAAEMEAGSHDDESGPPRDSPNTDEASSPSSSSSSYYNPLPSDSLEGKSLISDSRGTNSGSTTGSETPHRDSDNGYSYFSHPKGVKFPIPLSKFRVPLPTPPKEDRVMSEAAFLRYLAHRSSMPSPSTMTPLKKSNSQFLAVPKPVYTYRPRHSRANRKREKRRANANTVSALHVHAADTQRCPSPFPSVRPPSTSSLMSPLFPPIAGSEGGNSGPATETPAKPRLRISKNVGGAQRPLPEIVRPGLQRAGRLIVPGPSPAQFIASPFVPRRVGEVPIVILEEEEGEGEKRGV
ncbi:hypothetical protein GGR58DRAFT_15023 [Xylaria digitata]|nr:hypothetical protein GGR58DRAFT_15023 [Xylaria digitata]